jgi:hypothetical protein
MEEEQLDLSLWLMCVCDEIEPIHQRIAAYL